MVVVSSGALAPELVGAVQVFRGAIYLADGAIPELIDGRHSEPADAKSFHIVVLLDGAIRGCIRYEQVGLGRVRVGGWAVDPDARYTRVGIRLVLECVALARKLGDHYATATATCRHKSSTILQRLGGRSLMRYYDPAYRCEMELLEFQLSEMRQAVPAELPLAA